MALLLTQFLFRAFYNQEELNNYIKSLSDECFTRSNKPSKTFFFKKTKTKLCRIFLKDKDENDQADDKFFKNPERQGIHD